MTKENLRKFSMKELAAACNSWRTVHGTRCLCTGPITWRSNGALTRLGKYDWDVARVNQEVTDALFDKYGEDIQDVVDLVVDDLEEVARAEWERKLAKVLARCRKDMPRNVAASNV